MEIELERKHARLTTILMEMGSALLAYSGGVDSALLLAVGKEALGDRIVAVTAHSPLYPLPVVERACRMAGQLGVEHVIIETDELADREFRTNPPDRCYLCKRELYGRLTDMARERNIAFVIDGTHADDLGDYRPGMRAATDFDVRSPLLEVGFTKDEVRALSRELGLETWDAPAGPCLASRIPYNREITLEILTAIEQGERLLSELGFREVRIRIGDERTARIEVSPDSIERLADRAVREQVVSGLKDLGFLYVTLDLEGYRTGSMNRVLVEGSSGNRTPPR